MKAILLFQKRDTLLAISAMVLFAPVNAFAWTCQNSSGQLFISNSPANCQQYYPNCSSTGQEPSSCNSPNFTQMNKSNSETNTSTQNPPGAALGGAIVNRVQPLANPYSSQQGPADSGSLLGGLVGGSLNPVHSPDAGYIGLAAPNAGGGSDGDAHVGGNIIPTPPPVGTGGLEPRPAAERETAQRLERATLLKQAEAENKIAIGQAEILQNTMAEIQSNQAQAVEYYSGPGKKNLMASARFFGTNKIISSDKTSSLSGDFLSSATAGQTKESDVKGARSAASKDSAGIDRSGKSSNRKFASTESEAGDVKTLLKESLAEKVAKLVKDASLRDKVKEYLAGNDSGDPEIIALAEALAQAEEATNDSDHKEHSLFASTSKTGAVQLSDQESQFEVSRLLASFGGETVAPDNNAEPLFERVHNAHQRSVERGNLVPRAKIR